ncbi:hypothetical protein MRB53_024541 [Persea americana]|uniref:Uncharacterized protein n=1 Tax=Persea americana TaxID=3435 RepID=A0ACC2LDG8_PERAE|nr:hypothetical protein MRB53_024541 [Persea americana]
MPFSFAISLYIMLPNLIAMKIKKHYASILEYNKKGQLKFSMTYLVISSVKAMEECKNGQVLPPISALFLPPISAGDMQRQRFSGDKNGSSNNRRTSPNPSKLIFLRSSSAILDQSIATN